MVRQEYLSPRLSRLAALPLIVALTLSSASLARTLDSTPENFTSSRSNLTLFPGSASPPVAAPITPVIATLPNEPTMPPGALVPVPPELMVYSARVNRAGNRLIFPEEILEANLSRLLSPRLRMTFRSGTRFSPESVRVALNGLRGFCRPGQSLDGFWEDGPEGPVLVLNLSNLDFDKLGFYDRVEWIRRNRGQLRLWVTAPSQVRTAELEFVRLPVLSSLPVVILDFVDPPGWLKTSTTVRFVFRAGVAPSSGFECALDNENFAACSSTYTRTGLRNGPHTFLVRALATDGRPGPVRRYSFNSWAQPPGIVIDEIDPDESPTSERTIAIRFRKTGLLALFSTMQCSLDGAVYRPCVSPVRYSSLADGEHSVAIRRIDPFLLRLFGVSLRSEPVVYRWTIQSQTPTLAWAQTPETPTSATSATFAFQADMDIRFLCSLDGASPSACVSPITLNDLGEGEHEFTVSASGSNAVALSHRWMVDRTAPELQFTSILPQQNPSALDTLTASYASTEPLAEVRCSLDGAALSSCESPIRLVRLPEGSHILSVEGTDAAGNRSAPIQYAWAIDKTLPTLSIQLVFPTQVPTRETTASFHFIPSESVTYLCSLDDAPAAACAADATFDRLEEGFHRLTVVPTDDAGNEGEAAWFEWQIDRTAPELNLVGVEPPENPTSSTSRSIAFEANEIVKFVCEIDSAGAAECASPFLANGLADGDHRVVIRGTDAAGNVSEPLIVDWTVSTVAYVMLGTIEPSVSPSASRSIRLDFSSTQSNRFFCSLDGATPAACDSPATYAGLVDGDHRFSVQALNALGVAGPSVSYEWRVDATAPIVALGTSTPSWTPTASRTFTQAFSANESASFLCRLDSGAEVACESPVVYTALADGEHRLQVVAIDTAGNRGNAALKTWRVDNTPIIVSNFRVSNVMRNSAVITWTTDRPTTGRVEWGPGSALPQNPNRTTPATALGTNHTVTLTGLAANTLYTVRGVATDLDGRTASSVPPQTFRTNR